MKKVVYLLLFVSSWVACAKVQPTACFTIDTNDTIKVNTTINFDASCSEDAAYYKWTVSNDTNMGGISTKRKFERSGTYTVELKVENGDKYHTTSKLIVVEP